MILIFTPCRVVKKHIYSEGEVEVMEIDILTLDEILERIKDDIMDEINAKAETEYQLQKSIAESKTDDER